ncbi:class I SAM-dependent methyltransferase [Candidatus Woesearchaeota archaeon]|nr:class I SAM-dependent methyltransferase [Candidatus Woesearchaeota archaeon]
MTKQQHYYSEKQRSSLKPNKITYNILGNELSITTGSGVFSRKKIDRGTEILIENAIIKDNDQVLDMGCGYGIVSIALSKKYKITCTLIDINQRALAFAAKNLKQNKVEGEIILSNLYEKLSKTKIFDAILTNPPQHAGKKICFQLIEQAPLHLNKGGLLQLVARHNKGGKHLSEHMKQVFGNVKEIAIESGYRVYVSEKNE